jgi:GNAT superfamily N-acetyltransferase
MSDVSIVRSIGPDTAALGARAAHHLNITFRDCMRIPGSVHRDRYMSLVTGEMHPMGNVAIVADPDDTAVTRSALEPLLANDYPAAVIYPCGAGTDVAQAAREAGFAIEERMPAMAVEIASMAPTTLPAGYDWARIGEGAEGRDWVEALAVGYGLPAPLAALFGPEQLGADMAPDATVQFFGVKKDGRVVSTSLLYLADGLAGIYCVATLPEERNKGLGAHATAEALRVAQGLGYHVGVLQSSSAGHGVYLRLGFGDYATVPMFIRMPA